MSVFYFTGVTFRRKKIRFEIHNCGGNVTEEGVVSSPVHPSEYFHNTNCTWYERQLGISL